MTEIQKQLNEQSSTLCESDAIIKRVEITCGLFRLAYELKYLELERRNPEASSEYLHEKTLHMIEVGCR